jgi:hypothetical protein
MLALLILLPTDNFEFWLSLTLWKFILCYWNNQLESKIPSGKVVDGDVLRYELEPNNQYDDNKGIQRRFISRTY